MDRKREADGGAAGEGRLAVDTDAGALARIAAGDHQAFEPFFRRFERPLYAYFLRAGCGRAAAEDLVSETMAAVWNGARRFRGDARVSTWVFGIAHHLLAAARRRQRAQLPLAEAEALPAGDDPEDAAVRADQAGRIRRAVAELAPEHRDVVELTFYQGFGYPDVARILGIPVNTVKTRMFYARRKLRTALEQAGLSDEA